MLVGPAGCALAGCDAAASDCPATTSEAGFCRTSAQPLSADSASTAAQARQGVYENYWRVVGRDESLERDLMADILRRSIDIARSQYVSSR